MHRLARAGLAQLSPAAEAVGQHGDAAHLRRYGFLSVPPGGAVPDWVATADTLDALGTAADTLGSWRVLAATASRDLVAARLAEAHLDATGILRQLGGDPPGPGSLWGVWAAEPPDARVAARRTGDGPGGWALTGRKAWCSGAGLLTHALVTADDVSRGKPAPDVFLEAARRINVDPAACMAFEDATLGVQAATAAGMTVLDVRTILAGRE